MQEEPPPAPLPFSSTRKKEGSINKLTATTGSKNILVKGIGNMNKNFINITAEQSKEGIINANFKSEVKNFNQLISLGGALIQTFISSATEIVQQNTDEEVPNELIELAIMDALIDKIKNLLNMTNESNESAVDSFLDDIINGKHKN